VAAVETPGRGGRRYAYMTEKLLETFFERAAKGEIVTTKQIKQTYEEHIGHEVDETTISRLLKRHLWHKVMPKVDKQAQEDFLNNLEAEKINGQRFSLPKMKDASEEQHGSQVLYQIIREYIYVYAATTAVRRSLDLINDNRER
jgi:hypothetical protein